MRRLSVLLGVTLAGWGAHMTASASAPPSPSLFDFAAKTIDGNALPLSKFHGQICLVVNVASQCGFTTRNYADLAELQRRFESRGFVVLAFPSNQFRQESASCEVIKSFAASKDAPFVLLEKTDVLNGEDAPPVWKWLRTFGSPSGRIEWNFVKFLCDRSGAPVQRYKPSTSLETIAADIDALLQKDL